MKPIFHILFFTLYSINILFAQKAVEPDKMKSFNITVNFDSYTVKTQMLKDNKALKTNPDLTYCWYSNQKLIETKGGFDGKLIHGFYKSFYLNNQLRESGTYKYGVKHSEWKTWYPDGKLKDITNWKNGVKNGSFTVYNEFGQKMAQGSFKNNLLHGKFKTFDNQGNVSSLQKYNMGKEVIKQEKVKNNATKQKKVKPQPDTSKEKPKKEKTKKGFFNRKKSASDSTSVNQTKNI